MHVLARRTLAREGCRLETFLEREVFVANPEPEPLVTSGPLLTFRAITKDFVDRFPLEFKSNRPALAPARRHISTLQLLSTAFSHANGNCKLQAQHADEPYTRATQSINFGQNG